jgi:hypothetical protein
MRALDFTQPSCPDLIRASILLARMMDRRVKPGDDGSERAGIA